MSKRLSYRLRTPGDGFIKKKSSTIEFFLDFSSIVAIIVVDYGILPELLTLKLAFLSASVLSVWHLAFQLYDLDPLVAPG